MCVFMHAEMGSSVEAKRAACSHLSDKFIGVCFDDPTCEFVCKLESHENTGGACDDFPSR